MLLLIGVQENDDPYHSPWLDALAVSKDRERLERYRDWYRSPGNGENSYSEFRIEEILYLHVDLDEEEE